MSKVLIFAIDGGSWNVLEPVMAKGKMPHLSRLVDKGIKGIIKAPLPPDTMPAWINFATGVNPGKHGGYSFFKLSSDFNKRDIFSGDEILAKRFYEFLDAKGKKCILVNLPGSFPMRLKNGLGTASFLNSSSRNWFPENLDQEIPELKSYRIFPDLFVYQGGLSQRFMDEILDVEEKRFAVGKKLFKKEWDFFFYLVSGSDWLLHKAGDGFFSGQPEAVDFVERFFSRIDEMLGWFLENAKGADVIILSDHGFKLFEGKFFINRWLIESGFLKIGWDPWSALSQQDKIRAVIERKMERRPGWQRLSQLVFEEVPMVFSLLGRLVYFFPWLFPRLEQMGVGELGVKIDADQSQAFSNGLFVRLAKKGLRKKLIRKLEQLEHQGKKVFGDVHQREEVYWGECLEQIPDLVMERGSLVVESSLTRGRVFKDKMTASHSKEGILIASGPQLKRLKKGTEVAARLIDIAPTVLKLFNHQIPEYMDGKRL